MILLYVYLLALSMVGYTGSSSTQPLSHIVTFSSLNYFNELRLTLQRIFIFSLLSVTFSSSPSRPFSLSLSLQAQMLSQTHLLSQSSAFPPLSSNSSAFIPKHHHTQLLSFSSISSSLSSSRLSLSSRRNLTSISMAASNSDLLSNQFDLLQQGFNNGDIERFADVANKLADASGEVIRSFFRKKFEILDKDDLSPVTIADQMAEESMASIIMENFPSHAIYGEENGWRCKEKHSDHVWVLDPIDGTKSFITGKPVFGTLIALLYKGKPILGVIDQPILRERWIGISGKKTTLNGQEVSTRSCTGLSQAYMYTTSPHLFAGAAEDAFIRVRNKVKVPLYGCDCYAYALLASGFVDLVVESGLKPYDFLALVPVIKGAGGTITDWKGGELHWEASPESQATGFNVVAAGDAKLHQDAILSLEWK
ncbi:bifunctional phosphatase IMPL2, chloroplastic [Beta vulgaris subsp. vulgaris]|uniref:bifunctional phosphatase IMPL2, chloroplastic n=1 Tax=Beta vulgaris subsp. vulgaris TaxID=3555 RepID=UPI002548E4A8|nr:bifunctional phosphatase IMPL2, chloroplastic [Beta vulgaris subsp. vulgaris]